MSKNKLFRCAVLSLCLCLFVCLLGAPAVLADDNKDSLANKASSAKEQYQNESKKLDELEDQKEDTQQQLNEYQNQVNQVRGQLNAVYTQLQEAQTKRDEAQGIADTAAAAYAEKQAAYDERYQNAKAQLAAMQQLDDGGGLAMLAEAKSLYELLSFAQVLEDITTKNNEVMAALAAEAEELNRQKEAAEDAAAQAQAAADTLAGQQTQLDAKVGELTTALQQANTALSEQEAAAEAQEAVTAESKKAYEQASAELNAYANSQSGKYTAADMHCSLDFICPLDSYRLTCHYMDPDPWGLPHNGTDLAAGAGTPIHAAADGVVSVASAMPSYGNCVQISHGTADDGHRYDSLYAHMSSIAVSAGQTVSKGDVIGYVGATGQAQGNHLHLELRQDGGRINPQSYIGC